MSKVVSLTKKVPNRLQLEQAVSTEFSTFTSPLPTTLLTVEEFFNEYERLFYDIPSEGEFDSHQYLIRRSSELVNIENDTTDIEPLLDEIALLRERILQLTTENIELQARISE